jgi:hypothetical protein
MSCCGDNRKFNCGGLKTPAVCVTYRSYLPKYSKLDKDCAVIEETTEELYKNQEFILKSIDTSKLVEDCIDYPMVEIDGEDKILVVDVLQKLQDEICDLKDNTGSDCDCIDVTKIDLKCLEDEPCANPTSVTSILQLMIDKICELNIRVGQLELS